MEDQVYNPNGQTLLLTCHSCGSLSKSGWTSCQQCGCQLMSADLTIGVEQHHTMQSVTVESAHHYHIQEADGHDITYPSVEVVQPSVSDLLFTYTQVIEQLKAEGCLIYSILYNPKDGSSETHHAGLPETIVDNVTATISGNFPKQKRRKRRKKELTAEEEIEQKYACTECDYRTKHGWVLKHHLRLHTGEKPYECGYCHFRSNDLCNMKKHKLKHEIITPHKCEICHLYFEKSRGLAHHKNLKHNTRRRGDNDKGKLQKLKCEVCEYECTSNQAFVKHKMIHTGERPLQCSMCAYRAREPTSLQLHMKNHQTMDTKTLGCANCAYRTDYAAALNKHMLLFHQENSNNVGTSQDESTSVVQVYKTKKRKERRTGPWKCTKCDLGEFASLKDLNQHKREVHLSLKHQRPFVMTETQNDMSEVYRCNRCNFSSLVYSDTEAHLSKHFVYRHNCDKCEYKCNLATTFTTHQRIVHGAEIPYCCKRCLFQTHDRKEFAQHKLSDQHKNNVRQCKTKSGGVGGKYKCGQCSYSVDSKVYLKAHEKAHIVKFFQCSFCGVIFCEERLFRIHEGRHKQDRKKWKQGSGSSDTAGAIKNKYQMMRVIGASSVSASCDNADEQLTVDESITSVLKSYDKVPQKTDNPLKLAPESFKIAKKALPKLTKLLSVTTTTKVKPRDSNTAAHVFQSLPAVEVLPERGHDDVSGLLKALVEDV